MAPAFEQPAGLHVHFSHLLTTICGDMTGDEARAIRRGIGLSAHQVGLEMGVDESSVYRWEHRGSHAVPRMYMRALRDLVRERSLRLPDGKANDGNN